MARANRWQAPLVVSQSTAIGVAATAGIDEVQRIAPPPAAILCGRTAFVVRKYP